MGLAGGSILCTALSVALGLHFFSHASGPFVTKQDCLRYTSRRKASSVGALRWRSIALERAPAVGASAFWPLVVAGIALIILTDAMLRFRTVTAIKSNGYEITHGLAPFAWLIESVRLGSGHFWQVSTHMCLLRLAALVIMASLLILPVVLIETIVMPQTMRLFQASWVLPPTIPLICASVASVCAVLRAFSIVYDARLYLALSQNSKSTSATPFSRQYLR
jgi:hypothetical protein